MDAADLVGYIVANRPDGYYVYACDEHAPAISKKLHLQILREEATEVGATCDGCGLELAEAETAP